VALQTKLNLAIAKDNIPTPRDHPETATQAWERLQQGNERFVSGDMTSFLATIAEECNPTVRANLVRGQHPFATVLTCSDSRCAPELIFDEGLGEIFVIRAAGNIVDKISLGSIEYAIEHLKTPLLLIMGHQGCGAVTAALGATDLPTGDTGIDHIIQKIYPVADKVKKSEPEATKHLGLAVAENVIACQQDILASSKLIKEAVDSGKLSMMTTVYHLDTGRVEPI